MANYSRKKFSPTSYRLATIHPRETTDGPHGWTDDNHANSSTVT